MQTSALLAELNGKTLALTADTVYVRYRRDDPASTGRAIDTAFYDFFAAAYPELKMFRQPDEIFAVARIPHGSHAIGYLLRVPSQYDATAIDLWVFDTADSTWAEPVEVADGFGDGEWHFVLDGWIVDVTGDGAPDIIQRRRDKWNDDDGTEHQADSLFTRIWQGKRYEARTLSADDQLRRRFDVPDWQ